MESLTKSTTIFSRLEKSLKIPSDLATRIFARGCEPAAYESQSISHPSTTLCPRLSNVFQQFWQLDHENGAPHYFARAGNLPTSRAASPDAISDLTQAAPTEIRTRADLRARAACYGALESNFRSGTAGSAHGKSMDSSAQNMGGLEQVSQTINRQKRFSNLFRWTDR